MKVFNREKYLRVMDEIDPSGAEKRRRYVWPSQCDGKTEAECNELHYEITPDWMEEWKESQRFSRESSVQGNVERGLDGGAL